MGDDLPGPGSYDPKKGKGIQYSFGKNDGRENFKNDQLGPGLYDPNFFAGSKRIPKK